MALVVANKVVPTQTNFLSCGAVSAVTPHNTQPIKMALFTAFNTSFTQKQLQAIMCRHTQDTHK